MRLCCARSNMTVTIARLCPAVECDIGYIGWRRTPGASSEPTAAHVRVGAHGARDPVSDIVVVAIQRP